MYIVCMNVVRLKAVFACVFARLLFVHRNDLWICAVIFVDGCGSVGFVFLDSSNFSLSISGMSGKGGWGV